MWAQILCYKNQGIHWYHCNPTFLWRINFTLVRRLISALIWDISGLWNLVQTAEILEKNGLSFQDFWRRTWIHPTTITCPICKICIEKIHDMSIEQPKLLQIELCNCNCIQPVKLWHSKILLIERYSKLDFTNPFLKECTKWYHFTRTNGIGSAFAN